MLRRLAFALGLALVATSTTLAPDAAALVRAIAPRELPFFASRIEPVLRLADQFPELRPAFRRVLAKSWVESDRIPNCPYNASTSGRPGERAGCQSADRVALQPAQLGDGPRAADEETQVVSVLHELVAAIPIQGKLPPPMDSYMHVAVFLSKLPPAATPEALRELARQLQDELKRQGFGAYYTFRDAAFYSGLLDPERSKCPAGAETHRDCWIPELRLQARLFELAPRNDYQGTDLNHAHLLWVREMLRKLGDDPDALPPLREDEIHALYERGLQTGQVLLASGNGGDRNLRNEGGRTLDQSLAESRRKVALDAIPGTYARMTGILHLIQQVPDLYDQLHVGALDHKEWYVDERGIATCPLHPESKDSCQDDDRYVLDGKLFHADAKLDPRLVDRRVRAVARELAQELPLPASGRARIAALLSRAPLPTPEELRDALNAIGFKSFDGEWFTRYEPGPLRTRTEQMAQEFHALAGECASVPEPARRVACLAEARGQVVRCHRESEKPGALTACFTEARAKISVGLFGRRFTPYALEPEPAMCAETAPMDAELAGLLESLRRAGARMPEAAKTRCLPIELRAGLPAGVRKTDATVAPANPSAPGPAVGGLY